MNRNQRISNCSNPCICTSVLYETLELVSSSQNAEPSEQDIRKAYLILLRKYSIDQKDYPNSMNKLQEVTTAYQVLIGKIPCPTCFKPAMKI
ncbi:MAG: hypothetical protein Sylvanvirus13_2 [Sylvanvirus sp.]|uniref:J domain-containing protein n=1 Tax=Sylvanvirus sp. TaxID=2487774 RepID=A0A3G5AI54_9VIRU|nr:MAG: hypothetical protein Sylvanvirus13_2 [Sylvanvirus sp.]